MLVPDDRTEHAHSLTDRLTDSNRTTGHCQSMVTVFTGGSLKPAPGAKDRALGRGTNPGR